MSPLTSRKQLLVAESELNRSQLIHNWHMLAGESRALAEQARTVGSLISSATSLVSGLASLRRKKSAPVAEQTSWWQTVLKGVEIAGSLWTQFRSPAGDQSDKRQR
ncbi:MAG: hypothetical protein WDM80_09920 [Limisphaerales bacterium]